MVEVGTLPLADASALAQLGPAQRSEGLWRYRAAIAADAAAGARVSLGEGMTPLVAVEPGVWAKLEFLSPTGSFKDRGAAVLVAVALADGAQTLIADSSGNAGSAIAAYATRAGLPCRVFVPAQTSPAKRAQISAYGAQLELVEGDRTVTAERAQAAVARTGAVYASHVYDPHFLQGTKTFAFELWEQLGDAPDAVVIPSGNGTLLLGAWIGFRELHAAGLVTRIPRLVAVQSAHCAPVAQAFARGATEPVAVAAEPTAAEGIAIPRPARGAEMLAAIRGSGGCAMTVPEAAIAPARADLARRGLLVEPTAATAWAALGMGRGLTALAPWAHTAPAKLRAALDGTVVVPLCGSGLKSPAG